MNPVFFKNQHEFREWLESNHQSETELLVGYYKVGTGKSSMTWPESVDQALCFGWIDGVRKSIDKERYCIRFTPRKPGSIWSTVNIRKVDELTKKGLMKEAGIRAFKKLNQEKSNIYSFETRKGKLSDDFEKQFKASAGAWEFFRSQAPSYQRTAVHWIISAKQEKTRLSRLEKIIAESGKQNRLWDQYRKK
jgi:uncharacterized protein YdeI (YjbR/CyaY-like superfamily)